MLCDTTGCHFTHESMEAPCIHFMTHTDRYVQRRDPDRAVKPPPLELSRRQDEAIGNANSQSPICQEAADKKAAFLPRVTFATFD